MLETGLAGLQAYVKAASATVKESRDVEAAESFAHLLTKIAQVASELRKAEAAARRDADDLDEARVLEWFLRLETTTQGRFIKELQQRSKKGSGLA